VRIALSYDGEPAQARPPFCTSGPFRSPATADESDGGDLEESTDVLYDALRTALYRSIVQGQAAPEHQELRSHG
jgi:hypothetical protein